MFCKDPPKPSPRTSLAEISAGIPRWILDNFSVFTSDSQKKARVGHRRQKMNYMLTRETIFLATVHNKHHLLATCSEEL